MAKARDEAEWMRAQTIVRRLAACWVKGDAYPPRTWPHYREPEIDSAVNAARMESFLKGMDRLYGGK